MSEIKFACPGCSQHIACEDGYAGVKIECPSCGSAMRVPGAAFSAKARMSGPWKPVAAAAMPTAPLQASLGTEIPVLSIRPYWLAFWLMLLAPAVLSLLVLGIFKSEAAWMNVMYYGSTMAGIICGIMLARASGRESVAAQILIFVVCAPVLAVLSFGLCAVGCTIVVLAEIGKVPRR